MPRQRDSDDRAPGPGIARLFCGLLAVCVGLAAACTGSKEPEREPAAGEVADLEDDERMERLRSLPYAGSVAGSENDARQGVVSSQPEAYFPGYNLFASRRLCRADLIDMAGRTVHTWSLPGCRFWANVELLDDGSLLVIGAGANGDNARFLMKLDWDSNVVWRSNAMVHHDVERDASGKINALGLAFGTDSSIGGDNQVRDDLVLTFDADGNEKQRISILAALRAYEGDFELRLPAPESIRKLGHVDSIHSNSIQWLGDNDRFLVCSRQQDSVMILDEQRVHWIWGQGTLSGPHDARMLDDGNVMVFDNGLRTERSRVLVVNPVTDEIVWRYDGGQEAFFSKSRGGAQRLPNGNTLISVSDEGRAFEIGEDDEIVWDYVVELRDSNGERSTFFRMERYSTDFVEEILANR